MSSEKRKRSDLTLGRKKEILEGALKNPNKSALAKQFDVPRTTVNDILNSRSSIEAAIEEGVPAKRKRLTQAQDPKLDEAMLKWLKQARGQNLPVSGDLTKEKATLLAELLSIPNFKASNGWLENFKERHGISFKTVQGEGGAVDTRSLQEWQQQVLRPLLEQFSADDIFNLDESGLFWQLLPNKTMAFRGERCTGGKRSKERVTLLIGANMSGKEKFPLLAIGKSARPRAFKNKEIPITYKANLKAWMTAELFEEVLREWDGRLGQKKRKVLLFLDNFSGHPPELEFDNIRMAFFPPNTTANSQPMDQGIIENLKRHYKKFLLRRRLEALDEGKEFKFSLLDALHLARRAWNQVSESTIKNCFAKAEFVHEEIRAEEEDPELAELWEALPIEERMHDGEEIELIDFLEADDRLATGGAFTLEEIAEEVMREDGQEGSDDEEPPIEEPPISLKEAQSALITVRKYMEKNSGEPGVMKACDQLEEKMAEIRRKTMRQTTLVKFLS